MRRRASPSAPASAAHRDQTAFGACRQLAPTAVLCLLVLCVCMAVCVYVRVCVCVCMSVCVRVCVQMCVCFAFLASHAHTYTHTAGLAGTCYEAALAPESQTITDPLQCDMCGVHSNCGDCTAVNDDLSTALCGWFEQSQFREHFCFPLNSPIAGITGVM